MCPLCRFIRFRVAIETWCTRPLLLLVVNKRENILSLQFHVQRCLWMCVFWCVLIIGYAHTLCTEGMHTLFSVAIHKLGTTLFVVCCFLLNFHFKIIQCCIENNILKQLKLQYGIIQYAAGEQRQNSCYTQIELWHFCNRIVFCTQ